MFSSTESRAAAPVATVNIATKVSAVSNDQHILAELTVANSMQRAQHSPQRRKQTRTHKGMQNAVKNSTQVIEKVVCSSTHTRRNSRTEQVAGGGAFSVVYSKSKK